MLESILDIVSSGFFDMIDELFDIDVKPELIGKHDLSQFNPTDGTIVYIDFIGSITGVAAISANSEMLAKCFEIESGLSESQFRFELEGPLKEIMNTVAGKSLRIMMESFSAVTMLTPKVIYGQVSYPKIPCYCRVYSTECGDVKFYFSVDYMKLDMARALEKLEATEHKTQEMMISLVDIRSELEHTQENLLTDVRVTMSKMSEIERLIGARSSYSDEQLDSALKAPIKILKHTKGIMTKRLSDTIHYLTVFKNMLMADMYITRVDECDEHVEVTLSGFVTEEADLSFMHEISEGKLIINTKNIMNHTNGGLQLWVNNLSRVSDNVEVSFCECSPEFLNMWLEDAGVVGQGIIKSIAAHFYCRGCESRDEVTFFMDYALDYWSLPSVHCSCSYEMDLWEGHNQQSVLDYLAAVSLENCTAHGSVMINKDGGQTGVYS